MTRWDRYFHASIPARNYIAFRRAVFGAFLVAAVYSPLQHAPKIEPLFRLAPVLFRPFHLPEPGAALTPLFLAWCFSLILAVIGVGGYLPAVAAFLLCLYLESAHLSFGLAFQSESILTLGLLVMVFVPVPGRTPQSRWPVRLLRIMLVYIFFSAGVYKVWLSGDYWLSGLAVSDIISQGTVNPGIPALREWLPSHPGVCTALSFGTLVVELFFPLTLFSHRARAVLLPAGLGLVWGVWAVFGYHFALNMVPLFVAWLPWEKDETPGGSAGGAAVVSKKG